MAVRKRDSENINEVSLEKVISLLSSEKPITKKEACEILNISYNTARLNKIIEEYVERKNYIAERKKTLRGVPLSEADEKYIVEEYLKEPNISNISEAIFRAPNLIKNTLRQYNIPLRDASNTYTTPPLLEESSLEEEYFVGDLVYSARYASPALVEKFHENNAIHGNIYRIWIYRDMQNAYQPWYELSSLKEIQNKFKLKIEDMPKEDIYHLINEALTKAKKDKKSRE